MSQNGPQFSPLNATALQQPITLSADGRLIIVGNPGGPFVFIDHGNAILPMLAGFFPASVIQNPY